MSSLKITNADVFADSDPVNRCAFVVYSAKGGGYRGTLIDGSGTQETDLFDAYDACVAVCTAHADDIDNTPVDDKATILAYTKQIQELEAQVADLQSQLADPAEVARAEA